jgi:uncharacterized membrane protein YiaA
MAVLAMATVSANPSPTGADTIMARPQIQKPTGAFIAASWTALLVGGVVFVAGLWSANMQLNEKGLYFTILMYGLFAAVSLQKSVRDRLEGIPVTSLYFGLCWLSLAITIGLLMVSLWNAQLTFAEKGFYGMAFLLALFGAVAVQKNIRDVAAFGDEPVFGSEER